MSTVVAYHFVRNAQRPLDTQELVRAAAIHRPEDTLVDGHALKINKVSRPLCLPTLRTPREEGDGILPQPDEVLKHAHLTLT
jgi:hypothetical protein